jgi:uncharacterized membrane protein
MHASPLHYFPITGPFLAILVVLFVVVLALVQLGVLEYAYAKIGIQPRYVFLLLLLSLLGSYINIPVAQIREKQVVSNKVISDWGVQYVVPEVEEWPQTVIAVNVGGALIPTILSLYLLFKNRLYIQSFAGVMIVALIVHQLAHAVPGVGIAMPPLIPPLLAAGVALLLSRQSSPALAYISGSLGTLVGADLMNLGSIQGLHAPVLSIGGAGTFDGVFLTGILAVLLA